MRVGERVELRCGKCGGQEGVIVATVEHRGHVAVLRVRLDGTGRVVTVDPTKVEAL